MSDTFKLFLFLSVISGCTPSVTVTVEVTETDVITPPEPVEEIVTNPLIGQLLSEAEEAFARNYLTTPVEDNAYSKYLQVLSLHPGNIEAEQGIANIVDRYLDWAIVNARNDNIRKATDYLNKAKSIDNTHPGIPSVTSLITDSQNRKSVSFPLNSSDLIAGNQLILEQLHEVAKEIQNLNATVVIKAATDALGRWIYQQLNQTSDRPLSGEQSQCHLRIPPFPTHHFKVLAEPVPKPIPDKHTQSSTNSRWLWGVRLRKPNVEAPNWGRKTTGLRRKRGNPGGTRRRWSK